MAGVTACSAAPPAEGTNSTSSKNLAPQASIRSAASSKTTAAYGITTWKIFRGQSNMIMTGYNKKGAAVKGVSLGFAKGGDGTAMVAKVNDGSKFQAVHSLAAGTNTANAKLTPASQAFVKQAASDATQINKRVPRSHRVHADGGRESVAVRVRTSPASSRRRSSA